MECRKRFQKLVDEEKELEEKSKPVSESVVVEPPSEIPDALEDARVDPPPVDSIFDDEGCSPLCFWCCHSSPDISQLC